ncbi:myeloperoxidase [Acrocarpospora pleiomorpha]|uniref:Myeloperoxidase n=1 Tax=Acrocarpospora pleiomorpha TaxID=90975 RepID=A0A5M3XZ92_9ACTN|nr:heme peroxidase family protein [Acrocarpospora pleiomorpha]GES26437.1 myeloperoxidase [Acrocarpospora pleiomorpha]
MERHLRDEYYVVNEGVYRGRRGVPSCVRPSTREEIRRFRFSRLVAPDLSGAGEAGPALSEELLGRLADAMTVQDQAEIDSQPDSVIPAGYTYLGQKIDHDVTMDLTSGSLNSKITVEELLQGRSPALDLDSLYGLGPAHPDSAGFYASDGVRLLMGKNIAGGDMPALDDFDLPRREVPVAGRGTALIPDHRNDENLAVAQIHLAFIRFHNKVVADLAGAGTPSVTLFETARELVVKHYQWMIRHDYLPRIVDPGIVDDVFKYGRRFFETSATQPGDTPTMPVEFSMAAFRFGHSMVRDRYEWNSVFNSDPTAPRHRAQATLQQLFRFSGTGGDRTFDVSLPSDWIADYCRLFDLTTVPGADAAFRRSPAEFNFAKRIDTLVVDFLRRLPPATFGAAAGVSVSDRERNLAFRNLMRANTVGLASGRRAAALLEVEALDDKQILVGSGGADLAGLSEADQRALVANTPLWFYILREAEINGGRLTGVGGRIVAEVFHRAMEGSRHSIVREPSWRPTLGLEPGKFDMPHLLIYAFENRSDLLNRVG